MPPSQPAVQDAQPGPRLHPVNLAADLRYCLDLLAGRQDRSDRTQCTSTCGAVDPNAGPVFLLHLSL